MSGEDVLQSGTEHRTCHNCNATKPVAAGVWAFKPGGAPLKICFACQQARKADSHAQRAMQALQPLATDTKPPAKKEPPADVAEVKKEAKLDVAKALKIGARITNDHAEMVMARVLQYANDPTHELHKWALELLAERILPRKLYEELGGQAAGVGSLNDKRPMFNINILPAVPGGDTARVINPDEPPRIIDGQHEVIEERDPQ
jgi:hypothetical protein